MYNNNTIQALFEEHVTCFPNRIAAQHGAQVLTYDELNKKANKLAHYLRTLGVKPDTPVALCLERSFDLLITLFAILKAGGAYLPMDITQPQERLLFLLNDSQAPILITKSTFIDKLAGFQGTLIQLDRDEQKINQNPVDNLKPINKPNHLAYIIYTSGSTGTPKGVLIEHQSVVNYSEWFADYTQCMFQQTIDCSANPIFDMSVTATVVPLMLGLTIILCDEVIKKEIQNYLHYLVKFNINIIKITPSYFKLLLQEVKNKFIALPDLKSIVLGGENLPATECQSWIELYPEHTLFNEYGPTEATVAITSYTINRQNSASLNINVPIGTAGSNMSCIILDDTHHPIPDGTEGELFVGGMCLARGYLNKPKLNKHMFITHNKARLYKTGDLCRKRSDGIIEYLGRIDEQVKIRGYRIEPAEIEKHLLNHPDITEVALVAQKSPADELQLVAYCIPKGDNQKLHANQLRHYLGKHVPDYMIPSFFVTVSAFPLTANNKLDKAALPKPVLDTNLNYIEPTTALEKKLAQIWSEELGMQSIGIHDDFFDLGGHSLSATRIVSKINHEFEKTISVYEFYKSTNIASLSSLIEKSSTKEQKHAQIHMNYQDENKTPLNDFQFLLWIADRFEPRAKKLNIVARKRLQGRVNKDALEFAFQALLKKHEALIYQIIKSQPAQTVKKKWGFKLIEQNFEALSDPSSEKELQNSISQLTLFNSWPKNQPLIIAKLFYLPEEKSELQICLPHLISDEDCTDILFSELSHFYQHFAQLTLDQIGIDSKFKEHVFNEQTLMQLNLEQDIHFWEEYLKDSCLFAFPEEYVVHDMKAENLAYSTYSVIPGNTLNHLKRFCELHHFSINNTLSALIALALRNCCSNYKSEKPFTFMNIIQSTRDDPVYDNTIGCFLRVRPIKVLLDESATLTTLSQQIHQSTIDTSNYQHCANLVKLCSVGSFKSNKIESLLARLVTPLYTKILKIPTLYRQILKRFGSRMISFKRNRKFIINLNIRSNFFTEANKNLNLFGLNTMQVNNNNDLLTIDYVFEASLFCDDNQNAHYLAISANLKPNFREMIAQEVFDILNSIESGEHSKLNDNYERKEQFLSN